MFGEVALHVDMAKFDHIFDTRKAKIKAKLDTDLTAEDLQNHHRGIQEARQERNRQRHSRRMRSSS